MSRRTLTLAVSAVLLIGLVGGYLADTPAGEVPPALATACKSPNGNCPGVTYRTAAVDVEYKTKNTTPVEPTGDTDWDITAYWNTNNVPCVQYSETATATVSWSGSAWTVSDVTTVSEILDVSVCSGDGCDGDESHSYGYTLIAKVRDPEQALYGGNLRQVVFTTSSVSNGQQLDVENCELGSSVSPTTQSNSQTDTGAFECGFGCSVTAPSLTIVYE